MIFQVFSGNVSMLLLKFSGILPVLRGWHCIAIHSGLKNVFLSGFSTLSAHQNFNFKVVESGFSSTFFELG
jgi:hypothetical protein